MVNGLESTVVGTIVEPNRELRPKMLSNGSSERRMRTCASTPIGSSVRSPAPVGTNANRRISVFENPDAVRDWVGPTPERLNLLDFTNPHTFGPYMNDDLINAKVQMELKFEEAAEIIPDLFADYAKLTGRHYNIVDQYGDPNAERCLVALNTAGEASKDAVV